MADTKSKAPIIPSIVTVTTLGTLGQVKGIHGAIRPDMYTTKTRDKNEEGKPAGEFTGPVFMNTKKVLSPLWDNIKQQWQFKADYSTFSRLVKAMNLRYPAGHPNGQGRIKLESLDSHRRNRRDPVFQNIEVIGRFVLENGRGVLRTEDPFHEFLYHCFRDSRKFIDETGTGKVASYAGARYRMTATNKVNIVKRQDVNKSLEASGLLAKIAQDEARLRAVTALVKVPGYSEQTDVNGMVILLHEHINNSPDRPVSSHGSKPFIDVLLRYMTMEDSALQYEYDIMRAYSTGIIRSAKGGITINTVYYAGPTSFAQTVKYLQDPANQDTYFDVTVALGK